VSTGDVVRAIVTTGAVNPVVTVEVGSYVSGVIQGLYCDYNTEVKAGQLCAKIDPRPFQVVVDQASANLQSAKAQLNKDQAGLAYASINYERDRKLQKQGIVSQDNVDSDKSAYDQGKAQVDLDQSAIAQRTAELHAAQGQPRLHQHRVARGRHGRAAQRQRRPDGRRQLPDPDPVPDRAGPDQDAGRHQRQ
jgi:HlyD family secretion protein